MKKRFSPGQEVVCIKEQMKARTAIGEKVPSLPFNSLQVIRCYYKFYNGKWWVEVDSMPDHCIYTEDCFAPATELQKVVDELLEDVNEILEQKQIKRMHEL